MSSEVLLAVIGIAGTVLGGAGLKLIEGWLGRGVRRLDDATEIRQELRTESREMRLEIQRLDKENDAWREKYFTLTAQYTTLKGECEGWKAAHNDLKEEVDRVRLLVDRRATRRTRAGDPSEPQL